jgi:hypothetical protein|tara:strand:+ start:21553 stop:22101 length:549 start_codon:yes stop_codon:yes gene_type:complete
MSKVAKLVYYSFATRVVVDESSTEDDIIRESKRKIFDKVQKELGENLEEIIDDEECPVGTFETDLPSVDRVILNTSEKQYVVIGKGIPTQVIKFDDYTDWDSIENLNGEPVFDVQIDDDNQIDGKFIGNAKHPYTFQYVNLIWREDQDNWEIGLDYQSVDVEVVTESITQILAKMLQENLVK